MKRFFAFLIWCFLLLISIGCNTSDPTGTTVTKIINTYNIFDTVAIDTLSSTTTLSFDTSSLDTIKISLTDSLLLQNHNYSIKTTIVDTLTKKYAVVDSSKFLNYIYSISIVDTVNTSDGLTTSDTLDTTLVDSLNELFINISYIDSIDTIETITETYDTLPFPNSFICGTTSDQNNGSIGYGSLFSYVTDTNYSGFSNALSIDKNNSVFSYNSSIYILEGSGADNIIRIDGPIISNANKVYTKNLGTNLDLQDISFASDSKAYITQHLDSNLVVFDTKYGKSIKNINLSKYGLNAGTADAQLPYMQSSIIIENRLFVLLKRLHSNQGNPIPDTAIGGLVVIISTENDSILDTIALNLKNPLSMDYYDGFLYISSTGLLTDITDGGIEKINVNTLKNLGKITSESSFGGNISDIIIVSRTKGYIKVSLGGQEVLFQFNPLTGAAESQISTIENISGNILFDGIYTYVCDNKTTNPGVVIIDPKDNSTVGKTIDFGTGLPKSATILTLKK